MSDILVFVFATFIYFTFWFCVSLVIKRNDIADFAWGLGFVFLNVVATVYYGYSTVGSLVSILITIWGFRLANHIVKRLLTRPEDYRYQNWRKEWGKYFVIRSYLQVYLLQGLFMLLIASASLFTISLKSNDINVFVIVGTIVWIVGFIFESVGDAQLAKFISNPLNKGKIIENGLWKYSRHPNYFGEVTMWWGIWLTTCTTSVGYLYIYSPLTITILILFVSGIPMLEKKYVGDKNYEAYKSRTSMFFPLPPKSNT